MSRLRIRARAITTRAYRAFDSANYVQALKELDAIDARKPDLAASQNLRGVIYMRQGIYDKSWKPHCRKQTTLTRNFGMRVSIWLRFRF